jgi:5,10-methylene-tetrahydrofolate dehydrogenase/methenyl tetrahydrofolate cyclohydrolase
MPAQIIDGKAIAATIRGEIKQEVEAMKAEYGRVPGLATVPVAKRQPHLSDGLAVRRDRQVVRATQKTELPNGLRAFGVFRKDLG